MKTIISENSLLTWKHTNGYGAHGANLEGVVDEMFLKDDYLAVFKELEEYAASNVAKMDFVKAWQQVCEKACQIVRSKVKVISPGTGVDIIVSKFRGNLGEIMAEKIFEALGVVWDVAPGSYTTVDPENEMFLDAQGVHVADGLPIGVQVKNYSVHPGKTNAVGWEVFTKSMAMTTFWLQDQKTIKPQDIPQFVSLPRQIIFSFTPVLHDVIADNYRNSVRFVGPDEIDKLGLKSKPYLFKQIVDEIEKA